MIRLDKGFGFGLKLKGMSIPFRLSAPGAFSSGRWHFGQRAASTVPFSLFPPELPVCSPVHIARSIQTRSRPLGVPAGLRPGTNGTPSALFLFAPPATTSPGSAPRAVSPVTSQPGHSSCHGRRSVTSGRTESDPAISPRDQTTTKADVWDFFWK